MSKWLETPYFHAWKAMELPSNSYFRNDGKITTVTPKLLYNKFLKTKAYRAFLIAIIVIFKNYPT